MTQKRKSKYALPLTVVKIVEATCADYWRREKALRGGNIDITIRAEYTRLNSIIESAIADIDEAVRAQLLSDVGNVVGYKWSPLSMCMSAPYYYKLKRSVVRGVAEKLSLI